MSFPASIPEACKKDHACLCRYSCLPYAVAKHFPCRCLPHFPNYTQDKHGLLGNIAHPDKRHKSEITYEDKPGNVKYPDPPHWAPRKKSISPKTNESLPVTNETLSSTSASNTNLQDVHTNKTTNCTTTACSCSKRCFPKPILSVSFDLVYIRHKLKNAKMFTFL